MIIIPPWKCPRFSRLVFLYPIKGKKNGGMVRFPFNVVTNRDERWMIRGQPVDDTSRQTFAKSEGIFLSWDLINQVVRNHRGWPRVGGPAGRKFEREAKRDAKNCMSGQVKRI